MLGTIVRSILSPAQSSRVKAQIERRTVPSWSIATLGHHARSKILQVEYANGLIFEADDVSASEYDYICNATDFDRAYPGYRYRALQLASRGIFVSSVSWLAAT